MGGVKKALRIIEIRSRRKILWSGEGRRRRHRGLGRFEQRRPQGAHLGARGLDPFRMTLGGIFKQARELQSRLRPTFHRWRARADTGRQAQCRQCDEDQSHAYPQNRVARLRVCHG